MWSAEGFEVVAGLKFEPLYSCLENGLLVPALIVLLGTFLLIIYTM